MCGVSVCLYDMVFVFNKFGYMYYFMAKWRWKHNVYHITHRVPISLWLLAPYIKCACNTDMCVCVSVHVSANWSTQLEEHSLSHTAIQHPAAASPTTPIYWISSPVGQTCRGIRQETCNTDPQYVSVHFIEYSLCDFFVLFQMFSQQFFKMQISMACHLTWSP